MKLKTETEGLRLLENTWTRCIDFKGMDVHLFSKLFVLPAMTPSFDHFIPAPFAFALLRPPEKTKKVNNKKVNRATHARVHYVSLTIFRQTAPLSARTQ